MAAGVAGAARSGRGVSSAPRPLDATDVRRGLGVAPTVEAVRLDGMPGAAGPVGLLRIREIGPRTAAEVDRVLDHWDATSLAGLVFDLRGNPGGRVEGAAEIAERFLPAGAVVYWRHDGRGRADARRARPGRWPRAEPLVVLVDGGTASAAELLAGALTVNGRACLAGARTFGKGRLERLEPRAGSEAALALRQPAGEYRLPNGGVVEGRGLVPDLPFATPGKAAAWLATRGAGRAVDCRIDPAPAGAPSAAPDRHR